jgi:DNA-binding response OmpR family regulator
MAKLLIVDDDEQISQAVDTYLKSCNFTNDCAASGGDALQLLATYAYDAIILDWGLPDISGFDVCVKYRRQGGQAPIIFLTGNNDLTALEQALDAGADDYMSKPFNLRELHARLKTILRRRSGPYEKDLSIGQVTLNPESGKLQANGKSVTLRNKENAILECLMRHPNVTYTSQELLDAVWPADAAPTTSAVRVWMKFIRQRLAEVGAEGLITTVAGSGYVIQVDSA